jgi:hypothetical protein
VFLKEFKAKWLRQTTLLYAWFWCSSHGLGPHPAFTSAHPCTCGRSHLVRLQADLKQDSSTSLPDTLGTLTHLTRLDLFNWSQLCSLPESIGRLSQLTCLNLSGTPSTRVLLLQMKCCLSVHLSVYPSIRASLSLPHSPCPGHASTHS